MLSAPVLRVREGTPEFESYRTMRIGLWPMPVNENQRETVEIVRSADWAVFVACASTGAMAGFAEAHLREFAEGAVSSPVGYLEGLYVAPKLRRLGIGTALVHAAEEWARSRGCTEMGSDSNCENEVSIAMHGRLSYREVERQVCFIKTLNV